MSHCLPAQEWMPWLEACRLDDSSLAKAYEETPPEHRACVKHCLALWHQLYGEDSEESVRIRRDATLGLAAEECQGPAPWALVMLTPAYAAPTRLAAALMPAILARVPLVGVVCVGGQPSQAVCVTLELAGVEHIFCATTKDEVTRCLQGACSQLGQGSVVLLHPHERGALDEVAELARQRDLPLWEERRPPVIAGLDSFEYSAFCHPDACSAGPYDASFDTKSSAPLHLAKGMQSFWCHPGLTKAFFRRQHLRLTPHSLTGEDS